MDVRWIRLAKVLEKFLKQKKISGGRTLIRVPRVLSLTFWIKTDINVTHLSLHILALNIEVGCPERCQHMIILLITDYLREIFHHNCFD